MYKYLVKNVLYNKPKLIGRFVKLMSSKRELYKRASSTHLKRNQRCLRIPAWVILPLIEKRIDHIIIDGFSVKTFSNYMKTLRFKGVVCNECGIIGTVFYLEREMVFCEKNKYKPHYHLKMYGINADGVETLMTMDHIHARALGGSNSVQKNIQTLCYICNQKKGDSQ